MSTTYRYPPSAILGDYLRAATGLAVGIGVLATVAISTVILIVFGGLTVIFLLFGLRTLQRHLTEITLNQDGIFRSDLYSQTLRWQDLRQLRLRYFGTHRQHRDGSGGFMQLSLKGKGRRMKIESDLEGFEDVTRLAAAAARTNGVSLDPASAGNLLAMGIDPDFEETAPG
ncbi:MAG: hypothetical protein MI785_06775 [Kiloniellales bacterium]|nr:hypothetical protein [Kiloniellales bacterium]